MSADPKPKAKINPRGKRARAVKDPVEKTDRYMAGHQKSAAMIEAGIGTANLAKQRANRLKELIEPKTEAMIKVMYDIAMNADHVANPDKHPSIHASIRMECADRLLSRAYGRPKEHVEITDATDAVNDTDEVMGLLNNILDAVGAPRLESPKAEGSPASSD